MKKIKQNWVDIGDGWTAQINLTYDDETLDIINEEVVCFHKDIDYNKQENPKEINKTRK